MPPALRAMFSNLSLLLASAPLWKLRRLSSQAWAGCKIGRKAKQMSELSEREEGEGGKQWEEGRKEGRKRWGREDGREHTS